MTIERTYQNPAGGARDARDRLYLGYLSAAGGSAPALTVPLSTTRRPYLRRMIKCWFPSDRAGSILDLGCGHGALIQCAREEGYVNITGVDTSDEQVAGAMALGIPGVQNGRILDFLARCKPCSKDLIITFHVIEHFKKDELLELVDNVLRVLKPGGRWDNSCPQR